MEIDQAIQDAIRTVVLGGSSLKDAEREAIIAKAIAQGFYARKTSETIKAVDTDAREIEFIITTDTVDRDSERVMPRSFEKSIKLYTENPVVLWAHRHDIPAVGRMMKHTITDKEMTAIDKIADDTSELAASLWKLYSADPPFMRATSVGFIPKKWSLDADQKLPDQNGRTFLDCELLEHSLVNVGSNRLALSKLYSHEKDPRLKSVISALIEQPTELDCGHAVMYQENGEIVNPCPVCNATDKIVVRMLENAGDDPLEKLFDDEISGVYDADYADLVERPFPNEHACRIRQPGLFQKNSFRRVKRRSGGKEYSVIMGRLKGQTSMTQQAFRYPKSAWTSGQARSHCNSHDGILFEPASKDIVETSQTGTIDKIFMFTMPGTYERDKRDIRMALKDFKTQIGIDRFDFVSIVGTTASWVVCFAEEADAFYMIDWTRDANGAIVFSNARLVEMEISEQGQISLSVTTDSEGDTNDDEATKIVANIQDIVASLKTTSDDSEGTQQDGDATGLIDTIKTAIADVANF